jgi:2-keto-3-deoxy-L-rhamnonate aldolase RhmA
MDPVSFIPDNALKKKLANKEIVSGLFLCEIRQPSVMQMLYNGGFDYVIIDGEHGPFNIETIADLCRSGVQIGITPVVRVTDITYPLISQPLDAGAHGLMIPRICTAEQVLNVVQLMKYPPIGIRGNAQNRGYTRFTGGNVNEVMEKVNRDRLLIIQIETKEAIDNLDSILAIPEVDVLYIGPNDLSISLGVGGQKDSPILHAAIEKVLESCLKYGKIPGIHSTDLKWTLHWKSKGFQFLSTCDEVTCMITTAKNFNSAIKESS